jgi:hypothetical protein
LSAGRKGCIAGENLLDFGELQHLQAFIVHSSTL